MGAMPLVVEGIGVVVGEVPAVDIIDKPVAVVVDTVTGNLSRVPPHVCGQVRVTVVDASIDHGHDHSPRAGGHVPCFGRVDVSVSHTTGLSGAVEPPEPREGRIVGQRSCRDNPVGFEAPCADRCRPRGHIPHAGTGGRDRKHPFAERLRRPAGGDLRRHALGGHDPAIGTGRDGFTSPVDLPNASHHVGREEAAGFEPLCRQTVRSATATTLRTMSEHHDKFSRWSLRRTGR